MVKKLYPCGKAKAFNITYDDGVLQDERFIRLLNKYNLKGTFNLNSQLMAEEFRWIHENGMVVKRLSTRKATELYANHEVASHTLTHPYMHDMDESQIMYQLKQDKYNLEQVFVRKIYGFAVPFSYFSPLISSCAKECGFEYARCSDESYSYLPPENYFWWTAGAFHLNPKWRKFAENFFTTDCQLALCQIVGHSYDLDAENMWEEMEDLFKRISKNNDIISLTNIEIVRYLKAMDKADISEHSIYNHSESELWFSIDGNVISVLPNSEFLFNNF